MTTPSKATLNRSILEHEKIFFYDHVHESSELPERFRSTSQYLRYVRAKAPRDSRKDFGDELEEFQKFGQDRETAVESGWILEPSSENGYVPRESFSNRITPANTAMETTLVDCKRVKKLVTDLRKEKLPETHWTKLLSVEFFKSYRDVYDTEDENRDLFRRWELHVDLLWNECPSWKAFARPVRTEPKPDIAYLFPIIRPTFGMAKEYQFDHSVQNFTLSVLSELRKRGGIIPSPKSSLLKCDPTRSKNLGASDLACFPWTIVEVKHDTESKSKAEFCYCQAANGSAEALIMREELAQKIHDPNHDALVIFSFTCVGPSVRLWLTFRNLDTGKIEMRCIWATSIELTWGVFALRMVIENMHEWVYKRVRPEISRWISHVRFHQQPKPVTAPDGDEVEQRRRGRSVAPPPEDRPTVSTSVQPRPASESKVTRTFLSVNTVHPHPHSPSPLSRHSAPPPDRLEPASQSKNTSASARRKSAARSEKPPTPPSQPSAHTILSCDKRAPASPSSPPRAASCLKTTPTSSRELAAVRDAESPCARPRRRSARLTTLPIALKDSEDEEHGDNLENYACDAADSDYVLSSAGPSDDEPDEGYASGRGRRSLKTNRKVRKSTLF